MKQAAQSETKALVAVRVRATIRVRGDITDTMRMLNVTRANHATIVPANESTLGMLRKAKDYVTWGEPTRETVLELLKDRARAPDGAPAEEAVKASPFGTFEGLADAILEGKATLRDAGLVPTLRLNPPRKGYRTVKRSFAVGGSLGYRGGAINDLVARMLEGGRLGR